MEHEYFEKKIRIHHETSQKYYVKNTEYIMETSHE
jgi:hypothetical protein